MGTVSRATAKTSVVRGKKLKKESYPLAVKKLTLKKILPKICHFESV